MIILLILIFLGSYLLGSIPFGFLAGKLRGVDLRKEGSGNIGATNAVRVLGKSWGIWVFVADFLKGFFAVKIAMLCGMVAVPGHETLCAVIAAIACILGHNFPIWLGFKGGKGIATSGGIMLGFFPPLVFLIGIAIWILVFLTTRYVSLASIFATISLPITTGIYWIYGVGRSYGRVDGLMVLASLLLAALALWRHRGNIQRLCAGTESRFERRKGKE